MPGDVTRPTTLPPRRPVEKWTGRGGGGQSSQVVGARRIDGRQSVERERERERKLSRQLAWWRAPASWISSRKWRSYSEPRIWEREKMKSGACWPASSSGRSSSSSSVALPASRDSTVLPISSRLPWPLDSPLPPWLRYCHPLSNWQLFGPGRSWILPFGSIGRVLIAWGCLCVILNHCHHHYSIRGDLNRWDPETFQDSGGISFRLSIRWFPLPLSPSV